jgi:WD40 repeat protein
LFSLLLVISIVAPLVAVREVGQRKRAEADAREAHWQQYLSDIHSAMAAWEDSNIGRTVSLLDRHFPKPGEEDLWGFEWYYLWRKCDKSRPLVNITHPDVVWTAAFSPDGTLLPTGAADGVVRVWNSSNGTLLKFLHGHDEQIRAVIFSPSGKTRASCSTDDSARLWDMATGRQTYLLLGHSDDVQQVWFSRGGSQRAIRLA